MPAAYVASNGWSLTNSNHDNFVTSVSKAYAASVPSGSMKVAFVQSIQDTEQVVSDDLDGTWTHIKSHSPVAIPWRIAAYYKENATAGTTTVTVTGTGGNTQRRGLFIANLTGIATATPLDGTATSANGSSSTPDPGAITTVGAGIIFGLSIFDAGTATPGTSMTERYDGVMFTGSTEILQIADFITSGAQTSFSPAQGGTQAFWAAIGFALKEAAGGGGGDPYLMPRPTQYFFREELVQH